MSTTKHVLLIEADAGSRFALQMVLQQSGLHVTPTESATLARNLGTISFDAAIIELHSPDGHGAALAAEIKGRHPRTRIIFITAYDDLERAGTTVAGAVILVKPIDTEVLLKLT